MVYRERCQFLKEMNEISQGIDHKPLYERMLIQLYSDTFAFVYIFSMDTKEFLEKVMQDFNQHRNGRTLRKCC